MMCIYNMNKIDNLHELANLYLNEYTRYYTFDEQINLIGWSLGGLIALEMATILEAMGYKKINLYLLDTIIYDKYLLQMYEANAAKIKNQVKNYISRHKYTKDYEQMVFSSLDVETKVAQTVPSSRLSCTNVILFKASKLDRSFKSKIVEVINSYVINLEYNNVENFITNKGQLRVINLNCHHNNILTYHDHIAKGILSKE